jgi:CheY-like chemotaxis protein
VLGEHIRLVVRLQEGLDLVTVDPGQFEQVVLNLAINSRDAMPAGGTLSIATSNAVLDPHHPLSPDIRPGPHVLLTLGDTGIGMDAATLHKIFEPFFTTKPSGKGTGLGLSTVYGIVKQSGGDIRVQSDIGIGTTFTIYLPVTDYQPAEPPLEIASTVCRGTECLLVVDDDAGVRDVIKEMLEGAGYTALLARDGEEALRQLEQHRGRVQVLLTDIVMPGIGGRELAAWVRAMDPGVRVLFMSGYTGDALPRLDSLGRDLHVIGKPCTARELTRKLREVLDA